jgi:hypothetical protein
MADLPSARYGSLNPSWAFLGAQSNIANPSYPARSTADVPGVAMFPLTDNAAAASDAFLYAAVPFDAGEVVTKITLWAGNTAASTPTHQFGALYSGLAASPALIGAQSVDGTTTAVAAKTAYSYTLPTPYQVKPADVPFGYLYAGFSMTATAVNTVAGSTSAQAANVNIQFSTNQPFLAGTSGSGLAGVAAATLTLAASTLHVPIIVLT